MTEHLTAEFGPADSDGFRTFTLYTPEGAEALRVSVHLENHSQFFVNASGDLTTRYLQSERDHLCDAASLASALKEAREKAGPIDHGTALRAIIGLVPEFIIEDLEKYFPTMAHIALQVAGDACAKHALNRTVMSMGAPTMYDEEFVDLLLADLKQALMRGLDVRSGRPFGTYNYMQKTREALIRLREDEDAQTRLAGRRPTSEDVAAKVDNRTNERTVRRWANDAGLTWEEWLTACGWTG